MALLSRHALMAAKTRHDVSLNPTLHPPIHDMPRLTTDTFTLHTLHLIIIDIQNFEYDIQIGRRHSLS